MEVVVVAVRVVMVVVTDLLTILFNKYTDQDKGATILDNSKPGMSSITLLTFPLTLHHTLSQTSHALEHTNNFSFQHTLSQSRHTHQWHILAHSLSPNPQYTLSTHPLTTHTLAKHTLSTHPLNTPYHNPDTPSDTPLTLSINTPSQHTLSQTRHARRLYVGGLPSGAQEEELLHFFTKGPCSH